MSNLHPLFADILRRYQTRYDRQEPVEEVMDEEELERREEEHQEWVRGLNKKPSNLGPLPLKSSQPE